ncbi:protein NRDE2 homolog [Morus notabilis]|uniref:protein NRDE2 homolog n=1 Tax=Morus notabilis TaxID=981085 RepID=UPI000CED46CF|nr:protein NRDE2 homolog [Morus notabilis]
MMQNGNQQLLCCNITMEDGKEKEKNLLDKKEEKASLFPLLPILSTPISSSSYSSTTPPHWLCNSSFTADLSIINDAVSSHFQPQSQSDEDDGNDDEDHGVQAEPPPRSYEPVESPESDGDSERNRKKKKRKRRRRERESSDERGFDGDYGGLRGSSNVRAWGGDSRTKHSKDYFFDSRGDLDNLAFGCLYRMDVARYKPYTALGISRLDFQGLSRWNRTGPALDRDSDEDALDGKLKSGGRYWSAKYMALESQKNLKRVRILVPERFAETVSDDYIPLMDVQSLIVEESWEDEVLRRTREFNKMTRERPQDEKVWLEFAGFQDKVAGMQSQKGARLQILEKKISILEKAAELNPENEELLLCLLKAYQRRDGTDVLVDRWEKILVQNSGSHKLWREFLHFLQGEFSRFKVSDMRKMYSNAIQALSAACSRHTRQVHHAAKSSPLDSALVQLELGLVDIFLSLCRFEWQAGYQELATALFQAEIEFSLFFPSLLLTEQSKQRLFEHFWNSNGPRVGEEGAFGWSTWLEKEEENRQRVIKEEASLDAEKGGWTGWSEPLAKNKIGDADPDNEANHDMEVEELQPDLEEDMKEEDDTEALLKKLGIDIDAASSSEVTDISTWTRWSKEELSRDCDQWMPVRAKSADGVSRSDGTLEAEADEHLLRVVVYEDVNEFLFSLSSFEARLSLLSQFVDFFGGKISQWICSNNSSWIEKTLSLEELPDSLLQTLRKVHDLSKLQNDIGSSRLEFLLGSTNNISRRTDMMKFLRNATLLCLTAFPRNYILEEAALVAEELSVTKVKSDSSVTPCRTLAKRLLKADRQDVLLCGVYARREAFYGNMDHARRVFDMALSSIDGLPLELRSIAPLIYFWYAETELANNPLNGHESSLRAVHILSCLGSGEPYSPFKSQVSSVQLLRAHQGFTQKIGTVRSAWVRGIIDDQSVSLVCSAALFEELTSGWTAGIQILDQAFAMVLPERRSHTFQIEFLFEFYLRMLQRHLDHVSLSKCWESICEGLQIFPFNSQLCSALVQIGHLYTTSNKIRRIFDEYCQKKESVVIWIFALSFEINRGGSQHRIRGLFEKAVGNDTMQNSVLLWRCYIAYEANIARDFSAARRIFFRAIHACPWSKKLWMDGFIKLNSILSAKELSDLQEVMRDKELNLRTDIYEILLQDELAIRR